MRFSNPTAMAGRLHLILLAAAACCALSACATPAVPEAEEPVAGTSGQTPAETPAPAGEPEADLPALPETPIPPRPLEGLRLPPTEIALPKDDQFRATNPGSSRLQPAPRPEPGAVIVRPPAE